jgi:hypothetical protein
MVLYFDVFCGFYTADKTSLCSWISFISRSWIFLPCLNLSRWFSRIFFFLRHFRKVISLLHSPLSFTIYSTWKKKTNQKEDNWVQRLHSFLCSKKTSRRKRFAISIPLHIFYISLRKEIYTKKSKMEVKKKRAKNGMNEKKLTKRRRKSMRTENTNQPDGRFGDNNRTAY